MVYSSVIKSRGILKRYHFVKVAPCTYFVKTHVCALWPIVSWVLKKNYKTPIVRFQKKEQCQTKSFVAMATRHFQYGYIFAVFLSYFKFSFGQSF